ELAGRRQLTMPPGRAAHAEEVNPEARTSAYRPPPVGAVIGGRLTQLDLDGQVLTVTDGNGDMLSIERDDAARPIHVTTPRGVFTYDYNATTGQRTGIHSPEGQSESYTYDGPLLLGVAIDGPVAGDVALGYDSNLRLASEAVDGL